MASGKRWRRLLLFCLLAGSWGGFSLLWLHALAERAECRQVVLSLIVAWGGVALGATFWVSYLLSIALQKSPRLQHATPVTLYVRDQLGRPVDAPWPDLRQLQCVHVTVDASGKHYRAGIGPAAWPPSRVTDPRTSSGWKA